MAVVPVQCPQCRGISVVKYGQQANGAQRSRCHNPDCPRRIFLWHYHDTGRLPAVKQQIVDLTRNGCGVRNLVRVLAVSSATVVNTLKQRPEVSHR
jgi:transposase-like protein